MKMEKFVCSSLYEALLKHNDDGNNESNKQELSNESNNKGTKKINRHQRQRYSYAHCQEIFKECPKKLADVVVNNDLA